MSSEIQRKNDLVRVLPIIMQIQGGDRCHQHECNTHSATSYVVSCRHRNTEKITNWGESDQLSCRVREETAVINMSIILIRRLYVYEDDMLLLIKLAQYSLVYWSGGIPLFQYHFGSTGFFKVFFLRLF
jgi:hypothetical protein